MTPNELKAVLKKLGITNRQFANYCNRSTQALHYTLRKEKVDEYYKLKLLEKLLEFKGVEVNFEELTIKFREEDNEKL